MRAAALFAFILISLCPLAWAQQKVPPVRTDKLIDRLYPGSASEIERRLTTTATLAAKPLATINPTTSPAPLILRFKRTKPADRPTSPGLPAKITTGTLVVPVPVARTTTGTTLLNSAGRAAGGADLQKYLGSLKSTPVPAVAPSVPNVKKTPVAVPIEKLGVVVSINRASQAELEQALKLDPQRARSIIEFRASQGRIRGPDDLAHVNGISADMIIRWEKQAILCFD